MNSKLKFFCIITMIFGISIIVDCEFLKVWETVKIEKIYGDIINGTPHRVGERVTKVDIGFKTIVVNTSFSTHIGKLDSLDIMSTKIFHQVVLIKIPLKNKYMIVPPEYGIKNGYYFFPILLIIASTLAFVSKSKNVRMYSLGLAIIMGLLILYILFLN